MNLLTRFQWAWVAPGIDEEASEMIADEVLNRIEDQMMMEIVILVEEATEVVMVVAVEVVTEVDMVVVVRHMALGVDPFPMERLGMHINLMDGTMMMITMRMEAVRQAALMTTEAEIQGLAEEETK